MGNQWTITEQWKDNEEEILTDWTQLAFIKTLNNIGNFSAQFDDTPRAVDIMESSWCRFYYDGVCQMHGKIQPKTFSGGKVTIKGTDWMGVLDLIPIEYMAADWANIGIGDVDRWSSGAYISKEVSVYAKQLIDVYTGETATDKDVNYDNLDVTGWTDSFNHPKDTLQKAISTIYGSARVGTSSRFGYGLWMEYADPDTPYLWAKPFGYRLYTKKLNFTTRPSYTIDPQEVANDITVWGGKGWPDPKDRDGYTETTAGWSSIGSYITFAADTAVAMEGTASLKMTLTGSAANHQAAHSIDIGAEAYNSAGELIFSHLSFDWINNLSTDATSADITLYDNGNNGWFRHIMTSDYYTAGNGAWRHYTLYKKNMSQGGPQYPNSIDTIYFNFTKSTPFATGNCYLDNLRLFLGQAEDNSADVDSIQQHGHRPRTFNVPAARSVQMVKEMADAFVALLKDPTIKVKGTIPYYDPDLRLNDAVEIPIYGVTWPLYISSLSVTGSPGGTKTVVNAGTTRPDIAQLLKGLGAKEVKNAAEKDQGGGVRTSFGQSDICFLDEEKICSYACMATTCQNAATTKGICAGVTDKDPCINTCQRYSQKGRICGATCQTISYGGAIA